MTLRNLDFCPELNGFMDGTPFLREHTRVEGVVALPLRGAVDRALIVPCFVALTIQRRIHDRKN
jgi:hypothetical protein